METAVKSITIFKSQNLPLSAWDQVEGIFKAFNYDYKILTPNWEEAIEKISADAKFTEIHPEKANEVYRLFTIDQYDDFDLESCMDFSIELSRYFSINCMLYDPYNYYMTDEVLNPLSTCMFFIDVK